MRGLSKVKKSLDEHNAQHSRKYLRRLKLEPNEFAEVIFLGTATTEPFISKEHAFRESDKVFSSEVCSEEDCELCHASAEGDKRVGRVAPKYCFNMYDMRWQKKTLDKKRTERDGKERYKYEFVDEDDVTEVGIRKGIFLRAGHVVVEYPTMHVTSLDAVNRQAGRTCKNCGGKISVSGYTTKDGTVCTKKVRAMSGEEKEDRLYAGKIKEVLACSKCSKPKRVDMFNSVVQIGRSGNGKSTSYQFQILRNADIPDDVQEAIKSIELVDWDDVKKPKPPNVVALMLGKRRTSKVRDDEEVEEEEDMVEDYDDEEVFGDSSDDDDDDENEAPARRVVKKKPVRR
jgi:hypothetical protein